jgi:hypothetical protein
VLARTISRSDCSLSTPGREAWMGESGSMTALGGLIAPALALEVDLFLRMPNGTCG